MTIESRLEHLERMAVPSDEGGIRIRVVRIPGDVPEDEQDAWVEAHPECVSKVIDVPPRGPS
jgi:hypothetical protein